MAFWSFEILIIMNAYIRMCPRWLEKLGGVATGWIENTETLTVPGLVRTYFLFWN